MYCTTQTDWSSSSFLKSTITPAVIKGQKSYHQRLTAKIREWVKVHPSEFGVDPDTVNDQVDVVQQENLSVEKKSVEDNADSPKSLLDRVEHLSKHPVMLGGVVLLGILVTFNVYQFISSARGTSREI